MFTQGLRSSIFKSSSLRRFIFSVVFATASLHGIAAANAGESTLLVNVVGAGTVTSTPGNVQCTDLCPERFTTGTSVTLTAKPAQGYLFAGWAGAGCSSRGTCTTTVRSNDSIMASFRRDPNAGTTPPPTPPPPTASYALSVNLSGSGSVSSSPAGIACGGDCYEAYTAGTTVTLSPAAASGFTFAGWSGGGCSGTGACMVSMSTAQSVVASFNAIPAPAPAPTPVANYWITWQPVSDYRVSGYKLYYSTSPLSAGNAQTINVGNITGYSFSPTSAGINRGATVYFAVAAVGSGLESPMSDQTTITVE